MAGMTEANQKHCVAVIGGATAGAEIASRLADRGVSVVVFEQNKRPYGKIEDGLPRWHEALREKEYETIDAKLSRPGIQFIPNTKIGRDVSFPELAKEWGFSAVVLANGAWRDRPLPIEGADAYLGKGLVYQNPFVIAFNHAERGDLPGASYEVLPGAIIVGGGLASIDVAKIHTLELTIRELAKRGIETNVVELEVKGIPKILAGHGLTFEDLGIVPPTIYYRRRVEDMPLMSAPEGADAARIAKVEAGRKRMLEKSTEKYCFKVEPLSAPEALIVENGRLVGLRFRRTKMENGKLGDDRRALRGPRPRRPQLDRLDPGADRGHRDEGRALRLQGLGDRTPRGLSDGLLRRQRRDGQGQHRRLAQARDAGLRGGRRGLPRRRRRRR